MKFFPRYLLTLVFISSLFAGIEFEIPNAGTNDKHLLEFHWKNEPPANRKIDPKLEHLSFFSESNQAEVGFYLYTPDGYSSPSNRQKRYPVVYHLHGGRPGAEYKGASHFPLLYRSIQDGVRPQSFIVFVNGGKVSHYNWKGYNGETAFLELVERIDKTYRTIADRNARFLQGTSQGGRGVTRYVLKHSQLFSAALAMAAGHQGEFQISQNNGVEGKFITMDDPKNNTWDLARAYAANPSNPKVEIMLAVGDKDANYKSNLLYHVFLNDLGIDNQLVIARGSGHGLNFSLPEAGPRMLAFQTEVLHKRGLAP